MPKLVLPRSPPSPGTLSARPPKTTSLSRRQYFISSPVRPLAQPRHGLLTEPNLPPNTTPTLFSATTPHPISDTPSSDHKSPDERILKLGKTLRILSPLLPTLLINPLPPSILAPSVTLHLFPSTHPHLPTVKGRTLYRAALWTVPVAWGSLPLVGNVKLQILSERIVRAGTVLDPDSSSSSASHGDDIGDERLVVRWRTEPRGDAESQGEQTQAQAQAQSESHGINKGLSVLLGGEAPIFKLAKEEQFTGLFIFSFDEEGRVASHTVEHAEDAGGWDRTAKFVTLTDWLIGKARGSLEPGAQPGLAMQGCFGSRRVRR